jgi:AraC-like DNA-binding protein
VVEKHLSEENFGLQVFQEEMNMSRSTLFRKLYALTSQSPTEFIRTVRLKRASSLLKQHFGNISQVAAEVGITNPSYFTKCFRKIYGVSPMDYAKNFDFMATLS